MVSFIELKVLFDRSHTLRLLERFVSEYTIVTGKKLDFVALAKVQDEFEHLSEVFEQDLRLNEETTLVKYCKDNDYESILRSSVWFLLKDHEDAASLLAVKAVVVSDVEKERVNSW